MNIAVSLILALSVSAALARPHLLDNNDNININDLPPENLAKPENSQVGTHSLCLLRLFFALQIINQALLSVLVLTFFFAKSVKRHPTVINTCIVWIIIAIISSLLFYAGKAHGPEPSLLLCAAQASLLDGALPLGSTGILALTYQLYVNLIKPGTNNGPMKTAMLIMVPYVAFGAFVLGGAIAAKHSTQDISRDRRFFYCSVADDSISDAFMVFTALVSLAVIWFAILLALYLYQHWQEGEGTPVADLPLLLRLAIFSAYVIIAFIISVFSLVDTHSPFPDLFAASIGPAYGLVLASHPDVYRAWLSLLPRMHNKSAFPTTDDKLSSNLVENQTLVCMTLPGTNTWKPTLARFDIEEKPLPLLPDQVLHIIPW